MSKKSRFFKICLVTLITIEIIIGGMFIWKFSKAKNKVLGTQAHIVQLNKEDFQFPQDTNLKYFYETQPDKSEVVDVPWLSYKPVYTLNSDGLNERFDYDIEKPDSTYRIITLGDSFTFGQYVNTSENWPEKLEDILNSNLQCNNIKRFEVINLGVPGYDIEYSAERFKRRGVKYDPDLVIWFMRDDDFVQVNEKMSPINEKCEQQAKEDGYHTVGFDQNKFYDCWRFSNEQVEKEMGRSVMDVYLKSRVDEFKKVFSKKLLVIDFSSEPDEYKKLVTTFLTGRENSYFYDKLINIYDFNEALPDGHPNAKAYTLIARDIYNYLFLNEVIPCNFISK